MINLDQQGFLLYRGAPWRVAVSGILRPGRIRRDHHQKSEYGRRLWLLVPRMSSSYELIRAVRSTARRFGGSFQGKF